MWASAPTAWSRNFPERRGGLHRTRPTNFYRKVSVGRALCAPPHLVGRPLPTSVGGDAYIAPPFDWETSSATVGGGIPDTPPIGAQSPAFRSMSGSAAGRKSILNLGHVLPETSLADRERKSGNHLVSCASLDTFSAYRKSPAGGGTSRFNHQSQTKRISLIIRMDEKQKRPIHSPGKSRKI